METTTNKPLYETIGTSYDQTRAADPEITAGLFRLLGEPKGEAVLDLASGSGNYTCALAELGASMTGVEVSESMVQKAKEKHAGIDWQVGDARKMAFSDDSFKGALCTFAVQHIQDIQAAFSEVSRVLSDGRFVIFTTTPAQMRSFWLWEYFPKMMERNTELMFSYEQMADTLHDVGFRKVWYEPFHIKPALTDLFLHAGKQRPELYFRNEVRKGIAAFAAYSDEVEVQKGLKRLREDLDSGQFYEKIAAYETQEGLGDYLYVIGEK